MLTTVASGETGLLRFWLNFKGSAPKEQPPRKLSGKRTLATPTASGKRRTLGFDRDASADGIILSGTATDGASVAFFGTGPEEPREDP